MTAAVLVAVIFFLLATLPAVPRSVPATVDVDLQRRTVAGAYHIHSTRSDGAGEKDAIAAAAARAGLAFIILTDHGDGTRPPDPPVYLHGVLCVDAVEISSDGGHYVALDMRASPYPLGGEPAAVVEDVHRLGGFGIAAHPDSPRAELAWTDWTVPIDGIEWLNADSEWRNESRVALARVLFDYALRPGPALASLLDRPEAALERWNHLGLRRPVVGLAGHDAHGGIGRGVEEGGSRRTAVGGIPSYEASFRSFSTRAILERPPTGDPVADARQVLDAIRTGGVFTVIDAIASPGFLDYRAWQGAETTPSVMGSTLPAGASVIAVNASMPLGAQLFVVGDEGESERSMTAPYVSGVEPARGALRVELRVPGRAGRSPVPWIVSNPIYFLAGAAPAGAAPPGIAQPVVVPLAPDTGWHVEKEAGSTATVKSSGLSGFEVTFDYVLRPGERVSQFAAAVADVGYRAPRFKSVMFSAVSAQPVRLSVQLRYPQGGGERWRKSVYVDAIPREMSVAVDQMMPADRQSGGAPDPSAATALLFVVDLTNSRPGDSNSIRITNLRFAR